MASLAVYGWNDNYVLIDHGNGNITIYDCVAEENIAGWHAGMDYVHSIKEALEFIENYEGWDGGGDVNVEGVYYDFGGHDYSHKRNLKIEMGFDQTPYEIGKSTKKSKTVKKGAWGQKCVNYLDLPVCPNCGSPNLHELEKRGNVTNCICDRCDSKCWFDDSFSTEGRDTVRFTDNLKIIESTKKSQPATKSFNDMVKEQRSKSVKKTYPEDLTEEQMETQEGYKLWANSISEEIWNVIRSVMGISIRSDHQLSQEWKEVSDLLIQAQNKAEYLANQEYIVNDYNKW